MNPIKALASVVVLILGIASVSAQAAISKTTLCDPLDATAVGSPLPGDVAKDCVGILVGDSGGEVNYDASEMNSDLPDPLHTSAGSVAWTPGAFGKTGWIDQSKFENGSSNALGFNVTGPASGIVGWTTTTPLNGTWVVLVKQSTQLVLYLFENLVASQSGTIDLNNLQSGGFSHISLISGRSTPPDTGVPAPSTWLLLGIGLACFVVARRRRGAAVTA